VITLMRWPWSTVGSGVSPGRVPLLPRQIIAMGWMSPPVLRTR
jgi:hypothetical protein